MVKPQIQSRHLNLILLAIAILPLALVDCALQTTNGGFTKDCSIPNDQSGSIQGRWLNHPIPIAFHVNDFNTAELTALTRAAETWNQFFTQSKGFPIVDYGSLSAVQTTAVPNPNSRGASGGSACSLPVGFSTQFISKIGIYKVSPWPSNYSADFIALTSYCVNSNGTSVTSGQSYPAYTAAVIEFNYSNFFTAGGKQPDLQSVFTHELGHLLGLDHSCGSKTGLPNCDSSLKPDYLAAIMFPTFAFDSFTGTGQVKRTLQLNDQSRANCLY